MRTLKSLQTLKNFQILVVYPLNTLFNPILISPNCSYSLYDRPIIPLELSPQTSLVPHHQLFPSMDSRGKIPVSSLGHSEVSTTHTPHVDDEQGYEFPLESFPFTRKVSSLPYPELSEPILPHGYTSLSQLISSTLSPSSLYQNSI